MCGSRMVCIYLEYWGGGGITCSTAEHIQVIITSAQKVDNVVLTQVWDKPPFGAIRG